MECCAACCFARWKNGAEGGTRTPMGCPTRPSNVRVYQFHHFGTVQRIRRCLIAHSDAGGNHLFLHLNKPSRMLLVLAQHDVEKRLLQLLRNRAGPTFADLPVVDLADGRDLSGSAGEEGLFGEVYLVAGESLFHKPEPALLRQPNDGVAGDAIEDGR